MAAKWMLAVVMGGLAAGTVACGKKAAPAVAATAGGGAEAAPRAVNVVQPGAPGQPTKVLANGAVPEFPTPQPSPEDVMFMQGMIEHHEQALQMVALLKTHTRNAELQALGDKIGISQSEEIKTMQGWLEDHQEAVPQVGAGGMVMLKGKMMMPMPGMLTPAQMQALKAARGSAFDHLFLTLMIQHHRGALGMVHTLRNTPGADAEPGIFNFATSVDTDQTVEIKRMQGMLGEKAQ